MNHTLRFEKVDTGNLDTYILVGKNAYCEHYRHLWRYGNPSPYISRGFTLSALYKDLENPFADHFIIKNSGVASGIIKLVQDRTVAPFDDGEILFLEKIYLLKKYTGTGIGALALQYIEAYGRQLHKKSVVLDAMQKGPATNFYLNQGFGILFEKQLEHEDAVTEEKPMYALYKVL